jgi:hypothetical protein
MNISFSVAPRWFVHESVNYTFVKHAKDNVTGNSILDAARACNNLSQNGTGVIAEIRTQELYDKFLFWTKALCGPRDIYYAPTAWY